MTMTEKNPKEPKQRIERGLVSKIVEARREYPGLADVAVTAFLQDRDFTQNGFTFKAVEGDTIVFDVPLQDLSKWRSGKKFAEEKVRIASEIAQDYGLALHRPEDKYFNMMATHSSQQVANVAPSYLAIFVPDLVRYRFPYDKLFNALCRLFADYMSE